MCELNRGDVCFAEMKNKSHFGKKEKLCVIQLFREKRAGRNRWISPCNKENMNNVLRFLVVFVC